MALVAGAALGLAYFGGLWWTVRAAVGARRGMVLLLASWVARTLLLLGGLVLVAAGDWPRLVAALAGFTVVRFVLVHRVAAGRVSSPSATTGQGSLPTTSPTE